MKSTLKQLAMPIAALSGWAIVIAFVLGACAPQSKSWFDPNYTAKVGDVPADVCVHNGIPVIYGITSESDGDVSLIYLNKDGDVVMKHHPLNFLNTNWKEGGKFYFTGAVCTP